MLLLPDLRLSRFDSHRWVLNTPTGHNLLVNTATARLFELLQTTATLELARAGFNQEFGLALLPAEFEALVYSRFGGYGLLTQDQEEARSTPPSAIKLQVELLSARAAGLCAAPLRALYAPRVFWAAFAGLLLFLLAVYLHFPRLAAPSRADFGVAIPLIYASIFVHEFGHIAACRRFGVRHGGIGFGFYLFVFPVLYADVTNIWQASRQRRIITNLGGIFSQLLYASLLAVGYLVVAYPPLLVAALACAALALWQFNPFIRRDGYWLLSDLTNTPNLLAKAAHTTREGLSWQGLRRLVRSRGRVLLSRRIFLFAYGVANASLFAVFAAYTVLRYGPQLLDFPRLVFQLLRNLAAGSPALAEVSQVPLIVCTFYLMLIRYLLVLSRWRPAQAT
ncbi:site-2 protease family protein [Hymenobacter algoricola]|uniref:Peptidase M50 domain-containing protein n=1 Tax=Hymenobacter algoricola TaxID=486267 RepID=A0ABP7N1Z4_9BACT